MFLNTLFSDSSKEKQTNNNHQTANSIISNIGPQSYIIIPGIITGIITGLVTVSYRIIIKNTESFRKIVYNFLAHSSIYIIAIWFIILALFGVLLGLMVKRTPMIKGSGIPQIKGILIKQVKTNWFKETVLKYIGGIFSLGLGLSLGREGPSIQLGGNIGFGISKFTKRLALNSRILVTAGASAGLAAAFNAPLAGVIFALEELHRSFSPIILACVMIASVVADVISGTIVGLEPVFTFKELPTLPFNAYYYVIILGIIAGLLGKLFNTSLVYLNKHYGQSKKIPDIFKPVFPLLMSGVLGFTLIDVLGGGHHLIQELSTKTYLLGTIVLLIVIKFIFTIFSYSSGVPGGIFLPLLVIGALLGKGFGQVMADVFGMDKIYILNIMVLSMAAYFTAVVKAPITGSILITEMTGSFQHLLPLITVCLVTYIITELTKSGAIYDTLLNNMLESQKNNYTCNDSEKILMELPVSHGSAIEFKHIKNIDWPKECLLVAIKRGDKELIPHGDTRIFLGDHLLVLIDEDKASTINPILLKMCET